MNADYLGLIFLFSAALLLFLRAEAKSDDMAAYVAHSMTGFACLFAIEISLSAGPKWLWMAATAVFVVNFGFLVRRLRHE